MYGYYYLHDKNIHTNVKSYGYDSLLMCQNTGIPT